MKSLEEIQEIQHMTYEIHNELEYLQERKYKNV